jgi:hypothetical protein
MLGPDEMETIKKLIRRILSRLHNMTTVVTGEQHGPAIHLERDGDTTIRPGVYLYDDCATHNWIKYVDRPSHN